MRHFTSLRATAIHTPSPPLRRRAPRPGPSAGQCQPTLWRRLDELRARGHVRTAGPGRATRYYGVASGHALADLRSRALHLEVGKKLLRQPELLPRSDIVQARRGGARKICCRIENIKQSPCSLPRRGETCVQVGISVRDFRETAISYPALHLSLTATAPIEAQDDAGPSGSPYTFTYIIHETDRVLREIIGEERIAVLHAFQKKTRKTSRAAILRARQAFKEVTER